MLAVGLGGKACLSCFLDDDGDSEDGGWPDAGEKAGASGRSVLRLGDAEPSFGSGRISRLAVNLGELPGEDAGDEAADDMMRCSRYEDQEMAASVCVVVGVRPEAVALGCSSAAAAACRRPCGLRRSTKRFSRLQQRVLDQNLDDRQVITPRDTGGSTSPESTRANIMRHEQATQVPLVTPELSTALNVLQVRQKLADR